MHLRIFPVAFLGLAIVGIFCGCGSGSATVSGEVTVDGKPLEIGIITYVPADSKGDPLTTDIVNGKYELQTVAGNKTVQISAPVVADKRKAFNGADAPWVEVTKESLPENYNSNSELKFEIKPGPNVKDWSLSRKTGKSK